MLDKTIKSTWTNEQEGMWHVRNDVRWVLTEVEGSDFLLACLFLEETYKQMN